MAACSKHAPINASFEGAELLKCDAAAVTKLSPGAGGFRFACTGSSSLYVIYDTTVAQDGSVKSVELQLPGGENKTFLPAVFSSARGNEDCASARALQRKTGESPFPLDLFGNPKSGKYEMSMAKPCGTLTISIGE